MINKEFKQKIKIIIDPSGNGTTGICLVTKNNEIEFISYKDKLWENHLLFIIEIIKKYKPACVVYENTNYVHKKTQGTLNLLKLIGGIVTLKIFFEFIFLLEGVAVNKVKSIKKKIFSHQEEIENLTYTAGRGNGWKYKKKKINLHQLDALIIYHIWTGGALEKKDNIKQKVELLRSKKKLGIKQREKLKLLESFLFV